MESDFNIQDATGDQITTYTYGTTKGTSAGDSKIGTGHLPHEVKYPDSTGSTDVVSYAYNAQGQEIWRKDQDGNVPLFYASRNGHPITTNLLKKYANGKN